MKNRPQDPKPERESDEELISEDRAQPKFHLSQTDCIEFLRGLPTASMDCIVTDPAYSGMNKYLNLGRGRIVGDYQNSKTDNWFEEFDDDPATYRIFLNECNRVLKDESHIFIMFDSYSLLTLGSLVREVFDVKNIIVWDKVNIGMGHYFRRQHELIVFASKGKKKLPRRNIPDVWTVKRVYKAEYPTQKPVEVFSRMLEASVVPGMNVCDPFTGSGSSAIAALRAGCNFYGSDISDRAIDIATQRCSQFLNSGIDPSRA